MLLILGENRGNYRQAARLYQERYPNRRHPTDVTIGRIHRKARQGRLTRHRRTRIYDQDDIRAVVILAIIHLDPHISSRQIQRNHGIPKSTVLRILRSHRYHPYHITLTQTLMPDDLRRRLNFCQWAQERIRQDPNFFRFVMFSDEATFKNNGELNRHNSHYWSDTNPHWHRHLDNQNRWSLNVWCGIVNGHLIGPYFFDQNLNGQIFLEFLRNQLPVLLEDVELRTRMRVWIQLDGAPAHNSRQVREYLNNRYHDNWIGLHGPVLWPARSPDLTSPDFYLWGFLKNLVFASKPTTREDMMERIRVACRQIPRDVLLKTVEEFSRRIEMCIQEQGRVFEHLL